jgi:rhamnosyltransferase
MVSVVIPTYNAGRAFDRLLTSLKGQTVPVEIVVIDSSSTDDTLQIVLSHGLQPIRIDRSSFNHGATRNLAIRRSRGDIIVLMTQDALLQGDRAIEYLVEPLSDPHIVAAYGRQVPREDAQLREKFARIFNYPDDAQVKDASQIPVLGIKTFFFSNVFSAIRRREFEEAGGFPEGLIMFEDILFAARLILKGYRIAYVPEAKVLHSHNYNWREIFCRYLDAGISFKRNPWFIQYASGEKEGLKFLKEEIAYLVRRRAYGEVMYALAEAMGKYSGYKVGLNFDRIPFSFWKRMTGGTGAGQGCTM